MNTVGEMPPTWIGEIIKTCRAEESAFFPAIERRKETACIVKKLLADEKGGPLHSIPGDRLEKAIGRALIEADRQEEYLKRNPGIMSGSPAEVAAKQLVDDLDMQFLV